MRGYLSEGDIFCGEVYSVSSIDGSINL